jgi:putative transposase
MFVEMCKYKGEWAGKNILQMPTFLPSTKICPACGHTNHTLTLADREWLCINCSALHDRDVNAAINIKNHSLKNCGGHHRKKPVELPALAGVMKQELSV